jgi:NAD(P)-dependent dehydrogenase (short-subunit alcohol dehydrogenase family)
MGLLEGKRALIFGLANDHSIAWGIAQALHREGAIVGFSSVEALLEKRVKPLAARLDSPFVEPCDVQSDEDIARVFGKWQEQFGQLDILVHAVAFANRDELGGEFIAQGQHPDGRDWRLSIDTPLSFANAASTLRLPTGSAVATSGVWEQSYTLNQRLYSHIIDTKADAPVSGRLRAVTVVTADAMTADAWATGLCAAGTQGGLDLATAARLPALFLIEQDDGLHQITTDPMKAFLL